MWLLGKKVFNRNSVIYYHDKDDNSYLKLSMKTKENIDVIKKYYLKEFTFFDGENDVIFNIVGVNFEKWLGEQRHNNNAKTKRRIDKIYDSKIWQTVFVLAQ